jgi:hypothetical protein
VWDDALLARMTADPEHPWQSERMFKIAEYRDNQLALKYRPRSRGLLYFAKVELATGRIGDLVRSASLPRSHSEVLSLWLGGLTFLDVGVVRRHSKQYAHYLFHEAAFRLRTAYESDPLVGLTEVYEELVSPRSVLESYM